MTAAAPAGPSDPSHPSDPSDPSGPADPSDPARSADPSDPAASDGPRVSAPRRGVNGVILRAWRARDTRISVMSREEVSEHFVRLRVDVRDVLSTDDVYPTYWLRLWSTDASGKGHQRAYTLVDPDPTTGTAAMEFYLHPGIASQWARDARPGDEIDVSILNGKNPLADAPSQLLAVGDGASLPAIADMLRRSPDLPATVLMERGYSDDAEVLPLPAREGAEIRWFDRDGSIEAAAIAAAGALPAGAVAFVSLEAARTRRVSGALRKQVGVPRDRIHALGYWKQS